MDEFVIRRPNHALQQTAAQSLSSGAISADLLLLLCCPETRQPLTVAPVVVLEKLEALRAAGKLINRAGKPVAEPIREGLLRADGALLFPVSDGIPLLVADEAVTVPLAS